MTWMSFRHQHAELRLPSRLVQSTSNLAIGILHAHGHRNIATALRRNARDATRLLPLLGITSPDFRRMWAHGVPGNGG